jgi:hypothetical protein
VLGHFREHNSSPLCNCANHKSDSTFNTVRCSTHLLSISKGAYFLSAILLYPNYTSCTGRSNNLHAGSQISQISSTVWFLTSDRTVRYNPCPPVLLSTRQTTSSISRKWMYRRWCVKDSISRWDDTLEVHIARGGMIGGLHFSLSFLKGEQHNFPCATVDMNDAWEHRTCKFCSESWETLCWQPLCVSLASDTQCCLVIIMMNLF